MANLKNGDIVAKLVHIQIKVLNFSKFYGKVGVMIFWLLFHLTFFCKNFLPGICKDKSRFWCRSRWTTEKNCKKNWYKINCKKSCKLCPSQSKAKSNKFRLLCTVQYTFTTYFLIVEIICFQIPIKLQLKLRA